MMKTIVTTQLTLLDCDNLPKTVEDANTFLRDLVNFIDMRIIPENMIGQNNPHSFYFDADKVVLPDVEDGITGTVLLYESHAAIHTWNADRFICVVISSCKPYSKIRVANFCKSYFDSLKVIIK